MCHPLSHKQLVLFECVNNMHRQTIVIALHSIKYHVTISLLNANIMEYL